MYEYIHIYIYIIYVYIERERDTMPTLFTSFTDGRLRVEKELEI